MKKIDRIYIACYNGDFWQTKFCVASIRKWYPEIKITLIKDILKGDFSTLYLEKIYNLDVFKCDNSKFGWGYSKLELFKIENNERFLMLDSDIVFIGKVLDYLNSFEHNVVVSYVGIENHDTPWFKKTYYDLEKINSLYDSGFKFPKYAFNCGQVVFDANTLSQEDFDDLIDWESIPKHKIKGMLGGANQGLFNYLVQKKEQENKVSVGKAEFMLWANNTSALDLLDIETIINGEGYPKLIHWAGCNKDISLMNRKDIVLYFQSLYYQKVILGVMRQRVFNFSKHLVYSAKMKLYKIRKTIA